jgi:hypothetical protein
LGIAKSYLDSMSRLLVFLAGTGFGARAVRWLVRERPGHRPVRTGAAGSHQRGGDARETLAKTQSLLREIRSLVLHVDIPDSVLEGKLKAKIARQSRHPELIRIQVDAGKVVLRGIATSREAHDLVESLSLIRGVKSVEDRFDPAVEEERSLSGGPGENPPPRSDSAVLGKHASYPPAISVLMAIGGLSLAMYGYRVRGTSGAGLLAGGAALFGAGAAGLWETGQTGAPPFNRGAFSPASARGSLDSRSKTVP